MRRYMSVHPLVQQLWFSRSEFKRCFDSLPEEDAVRRLEPSNCLSWIVGHLATQENSYWVFSAQKIKIEPGLRKLVGYGKPASTPPLSEMWAAWHTITSAADKFLITIDQDALMSHFDWNGIAAEESVGTMLLRNIYHYWYHIGEAQVIRQQLGHKSLPEFVGNMDSALYQAGM